LEARGLVLIAKLIALAGDDLPSGGQPIHPPDGRSILFLGAKDDRTVLDEAALLDVVAIYTRDLGVTILRVADRRRALAEPPAPSDVSELLRSRNAGLAFWCQARADGSSIELVVTDGRRYTMRDTFAQDGPPAGPGIYRAIALKLRASLTGPEPPSPAAAGSRDSADRPAQPVPARSVPPPTGGAKDVSPSGADERAPLTEARRPAAGAPAQKEPAAETADAISLRTLDGVPSRAPPAEPSPAGDPGPPPPRPYALAIDYALSLPSGSAPWRHAAAIHGMAARGQRVEIDLGLEVAPAAERSLPAGSVEVTDIPLRFGARLLRRASAYLIGAGALVGVHALFATARAAAPDRATDSTRTMAASFGLEVLARGPSVRSFAPEVRLFGELNAPNTRVRLRGANVLEQGAVTVGFCLGVVVPGP